MHRSLFRVLLAAGSSGAFAACGAGGGDALDTLPPMKTTSTTSTTTTTVDSRRIFYEVQSGDNLSDIASSYGVPVQSIRELNALTTDTLQVGQVLEIPNDVRLDTELPTTSSASSSTAP